MTSRATLVARALHVAAGEIGYNGSGTENNPASKYGRWWGFDGSLGNSDAQWCDMFLDWILDRAGIVNHPGDKGSAAVADTWAWYRANGKSRSSDATPQPGDLIVFNYSDHPNHIGIVESVQSDGRVVSIQGNTFDTGIGRTGNTVRRKVDDRSHVVGFCVPDYQQTLGAFVADNAATVKALVTAVVKEQKLATVADVKAQIAAAREGYATRTTSWVRKNGLYDIGQHQLTQGSKLDDANGAIKALQADVDALRATLTAVAAHFGVQA